ncbi:MAG: hypothetical protein K8W52_01830 [Deltaproteobacteria bacterium]|nr:hypothetical protein [Deltaproteobacteria bacterium]
MTHSKATSMRTQLARGASLFALVTSFTACGDDAIAQAPPPVPRTITGLASVVVHDEAGRTTRFPIGLHDTSVSAQFPDGDGWDVRDGVTRADGSFAIDDAVDGDYWLEVYDVISDQRQLLWTNATSLAFEEHGVGRGDVTLAGPSTTLTLGPIDGLDPAQDGDSLDFSSGNLGIATFVPGVPQPGDTTVQTRRAWAGRPLISAARHDRITLTQVRERVDADTGVAYHTPIKSVTFDAIEQRDGQDTAVTGTFATPPTLTYELNWKRSAFAAASADANPRVGPVADEQFYLRAMPGGPAYGTSVFAPAVMVTGAPLPGTGDFDRTFELGQPYPATWLFNDFTMTFPVPLAVPGNPGVETALPANVEVNTSELPSAEHPVVPLVSPPRAPRIAQRDLFTDQTGVGLTPTLSWTAPAVGTPTAYIIQVLRWELDFEAASFAPQGTLVVPGDVTSVRMPAHMLEPSRHYVLIIEALQQQDQDVRTHGLYTVQVPYGSAQLVTATFTP